MSGQIARHHSALIERLVSSHTQIIPICLHERLVPLNFKATHKTNLRGYVNSRVVEQSHEVLIDLDVNLRLQVLDVIVLVI